MNPADAPIRIAYQLTEKDLREALAKHGGKGAKVLPVFGACFVVMGVVSTALSPKDYVTTVPAILLGLFWFGLSRLQARLAYKRGGAMTQDRVEAELSDAGFESVTSTSSGKNLLESFYSLLGIEESVSVVPIKCVLQYCSEARVCGGRGRSVPKPAGAALRRGYEGVPAED